MMKRWIWPFELQEKIGEGGMGVVYRARYVPKNRMLAVKMLNSDGVDGVFLARFERELEILKTLRHPNIVHCFGGVCEDKQRFYAMELVEGGTLDQMIRNRGKLAWEQAVEYGLQMCAGLACAHERGVVHRDVKPGNFLITRNGQLKLSDFGLATVIAAQRITAADKTMGTYLYMAPEQIRGQEITPRTDLYALGCVLFEMITGRPPFEGQTPAAILHRHLKEPAPRPTTLAPDCPPDLERLILELLEKDPERRPESAEAVAERLRNVSDSIVVTSAWREGGVTSRPVPGRDTPENALTRPAVPRERAAPQATDGPPSSVLSAVPVSAAAALAVLLLVLLVWNLFTPGGGADGQAITEWVGATRSHSADVRLAAAEAIGRVAPESDEAVSALMAQLVDPDQRVRRAAAESLGRIGHAASDAVSTLTKVVRTDDRPEVRTAATAALEAIRSDRSGGSSGAWLGVVLAAGVVGLVVFLMARRGGLARAVQSSDGRKLVRTGVPHHNGR